MLSRMVGVTVGQLVRDTSAPAVMASAAMLVLAYPLTEGLSATGLPALLHRRCRRRSSARPVYLVTLRMTSRPAWDDVILIIRPGPDPRPLPQGRPDRRQRRRALAPGQRLS